MALKDEYTLYSVVAHLVRAVAKLAYAASATNGSLRGTDSDVPAVLDEVLGQLDTLLVLGTHVSVLAERLAATSGVVQRLRNRSGIDNASPDTLEEVRELVASRALQVRRGIAHYEQDEVGPDTERHAPPDEGGR